MVPWDVINGPMGGGRWIHEMAQVVPWEVADGSLEMGQVVPWEVADGFMRWDKCSHGRWQMDPLR